MTYKDSYVLSRQYIMLITKLDFDKGKETYHIIGYV